MKNTEFNIPNLDPWWVTGISDAEGNFSINFNTKTNKMTATFKVTQRDHSKEMLFALREFFNCGNVVIDNSKFSTLKFVIGDLNKINTIIIPHFDKYPLVSSKHLDYLDFKKAVGLLANKNITLGDKENIEKIKKIKDSMNKKRSVSERYDFLVNRNTILKKEWLRAFVDGEGSFYYYLTNKYANASLEIAQKSHDRPILDSIKKFIEKGYIKPPLNSLDADELNKISRIIIRDTEWVIKFFDTHPLYTRKRLDYEDWKKLVKMKMNKANKNEEGLADMLKIRSGMNSGRVNGSLELKRKFSFWRNITKSDIYINVIIAILYIFYLTIDEEDVDNSKLDIGNDISELFSNEIQNNEEKKDGANEENDYDYDNVEELFTEVTEQKVNKYTNTYMDILEREAEAKSKNEIDLLESTLYAEPGSLYSVEGYVSNSVVKSVIDDINSIREEVKYRSEIISYLKDEIKDENSLIEAKNDNENVKFALELLDKKKCQNRIYIRLFSWKS